MKLVKKGRAELRKDAASQVGQKLQHCSSNDGEPVEGLQPLAAWPDLCFNVPLYGKVIVAVG